MSRPEPDAAAEARRRRKLAEVFGDVLPEQTADDRDADESASRGERDEGTSEEWLRRQVPPHHG